MILQIYLTTKREELQEFFAGILHTHPWLVILIEGGRTLWGGLTAIETFIPSASVHTVGKVGTSLHLGSWGREAS